jgi:hypothetical protein
MAPPGVEAIVGLATDPEFGPVVMVGLGGVMTDLLRQFAVPPLEPGAADAIVASLRAMPLLDGYRGASKGDRQALVVLCVPKTSSTSCDQAVFVDQATGVGLPSDAVPAEIDRFG